MKAVGLRYTLIHTTTTHSPKKLNLREDQNNSAFLDDKNSTLSIFTHMFKEQNETLGSDEPIVIENVISTLTIPTNIFRGLKIAYKGNITEIETTTETSAKCKRKGKKGKCKKKDRGDDSNDEKKREQRTTPLSKSTRSIRPYVKPAYATKKINFVPPAYAQTTTTTTSTTTSTQKTTTSTQKTTT